ncbi:MAG: xylose isomerase [Phycisphaeraceae bacterium]|nr:xylose isomerase [Phycisphaeraceae bacterium]
MAYFPEVPRLSFSDPASSDPLAFRCYDPDSAELIEGRTMREHLRFAACFWHTMRNGLADPFGAPTAIMPWERGGDTIDDAKRRIDAFFEFLVKCRIDFWCFHDRDIAPEGRTLAESERHLQAVVDHCVQHQQATGVRLLWGTANLFSHPRYVSGAATSPQVRVFMHAAAQVKHAMEATQRLDGAGFVFWGGREGYTTLLNTDVALEQRHRARFLRMAAEHADSIGFRGRLYIEPKPKEPSTHQYDSDVAATLEFLRAFDLFDRFWLNVETNHATLAGHTMEHELTMAAVAGRLGSIDANMGTPNLGWDTDQFPIDASLATRVMLVVLGAGGLAPGGLNFDAKRRRESFEPVDLFHAHRAGMDAFARGLRMAAAIRARGELDSFLRHRYRSWADDEGRRIDAGTMSLADCDRIMREAPEPTLESGRQEWLESLLEEAR